MDSSYKEEKEEKEISLHAQNADSNKLYYKKIDINLNYNFFKLIFGPCNETEWSITLNFDKEKHTTVLNNINPKSNIIEERLYIKSNTELKINDNQLLVCKTNEPNKDIVLRIDDYGKRNTGKIKTYLLNDNLYNCKQHYNYEINIDKKITAELYDKALKLNSKRCKIWYFYVVTKFQSNDLVYFRIAIRKNLDKSDTEINVECELENILFEKKINKKLYQKEIPKYVNIIANYYFHLFSNENHIWNDYDTIISSDGYSIICNHVSADCVLSEKQNQPLKESVKNIITFAVLQDLMN